MEADINCLILGYLRDHDFNRTAKEFEWESRYSKKGIMTDVLTGKEYLMPSLAQIIQDYCAMKKVENELIKKGQSFCIVSLWRQFDALINQLKLLTMAKQANHPGRSTNHRSVSNAYYARVSTKASPHLSNEVQQISQLHPSKTSTIPDNATPGCASKQAVSSSQELKSKSPEFVNQMEENVINLDIPHGMTWTSPNPRAEEASKILHDSTPIDEMNIDDDFHPHDEISSSDFMKNELLKSPKRKRIRPRKLESSGHSLPNSEPQAADDPLQRKDNQNQQMTSQAINQSQTNSIASELNAIFDALLNSKSLQEKIADNINKVAISSQVCTDGINGAQETELANTLSTVDIEEVLNITRSDPTFDSLFANLDDIETTTQTASKAFESNITSSIASNFEPLQASVVVSERIEEVNSNGECLTDKHTKNHPDCFTRIEDHMRTEPVHQANINRKPGSSKRPPATVPASTSRGFQTLRSNRNCNIYIKKKSNLKSGTWKPPAQLTNSAVLTGSGSVSRARLNQTFRGFSHNIICSETEADRKAGRKGKASDMRARRNEGTNRDNCKTRDRSENSNNEAKSIRDHFVNIDVAFESDKERHGDKKYDERSEKRGVKDTDSMKKLNAAGETGNGEFSKSIGDSISNGSTSYGQHLNADIDKRPSHSSDNSTQSDNSTNHVTKPGNEGTFWLHDISLSNREVVENLSKGACKSSPYEKPTHFIVDQQTNQSVKADHSGLETVLDSIEKHSCITHNAQPLDVQYPGDLSSVEVTGSVDEKHCKRSGLTVRFDLPCSIVGDDKNENPDLGIHNEQGFVTNGNSETRKIEETVRKSLPKKSILKTGSVDRILLRGGGIISSSEGSSQATEMNLGHWIETRNTSTLEEANPELEPGITTMQFDALGSSTEEVNLAKCSTISRGNPGDTDEAIDLECKEKICFTEDGNPNSASYDVVECISPRVVDNRIEYTIDDIKSSKNKTASKRPKKMNEDGKRQRSSKRKEAIKNSASKHGIPGNEVYRNTRKLISDNQKSNYVVDIAQLKDESSVEATSSDRTVNGIIEKIHSANDSASLSLGDLQGESVEVDIVFETTPHEDSHIKCAENVTIEPEFTKELTHSTKDEKDYSVSCSGLASSTDKEKEGNSLELDTSSRGLDGLPCDEKLGQSYSKNNQYVHNTVSGITANLHSIRREINQYSSQTFTDSSQLLKHDIASANTFHSLDTESKRCASNQEDCHHSKATVPRRTDLRSNSLAQVKTNKIIHTHENDGCDIIAVSSTTGPSQNSSSQLIQDCIDSSNTGFQIISSEVRSAPHNESSLDESTVKRDPFQSDIFSIYLSDDSNDSTDTDQGMSKLPADKGSRVGSEVVDKNNVERSSTLDGSNSVEIFDINQVFDSGAGRINLTGNSSVPGTPELISQNFVGNNTPCSINATAQDTSEFCNQTDRAFEGSGSENMNIDFRIDQAKSRKGLRGSGKDARNKQDNQKSKMMTKSKKRKSGSNQVSQPAKKQDKVESPSQGIEVPKNLNIDEFLSRLKYT